MRKDAKGNGGESSNVNAGGGSAGKEGAQAGIDERKGQPSESMAQQQKKAADDIYDFNPERENLKSDEELLLKDTKAGDGETSGGLKRAFPTVTASSSADVDNSSASGGDGNSGESDDLKRKKQRKEENPLSSSANATGIPSGTSASVAASPGGAAFAKDTGKTVTVQIPRLGNVQAQQLAGQQQQQPQGPQKGSGGLSAGNGSKSGSTLSVSAPIVDRKSPCASPKPDVSTDNAVDPLGGDDSKGDFASGPKVPPLKIVIPPPNDQDSASGARTGKGQTARNQSLPYVVASSSSNSNDSSGTVGLTVAAGEGGSNSRCSSPMDVGKKIKEEATGGQSGGNASTSTGGISLSASSVACAGGGGGPGVGGGQSLVPSAITTGGGDNSSNSTSSSEGRSVPPRVLRSSNRGSGLVDRNTNNASPSQGTQRNTASPLSGADSNSNSNNSTSSNGNGNGGGISSASGGAVGGGGGGGAGNMSQAGGGGSGGSIGGHPATNQSAGGVAGVQNMDVDGGSSSASGSSSTTGTSSSTMGQQQQSLINSGSAVQKEAASAVELHPRKRKIRASRDEAKSSSGSGSSGSGGGPVNSQGQAGGSGGNGGGGGGQVTSAPSSSGGSSQTGSQQVHSDGSEGTGSTGEVHPHDQPITNCYKMFLDIRKQIERRQRSLILVQPKPPQGFKDYLMNRKSYILAGKTSAEPNSQPPASVVQQQLKDLYLTQDKERHRLKMRHVVEKEKLVLSVEQEILRVHGRAARAVANQSLPFSVCTILKDEEVYNILTPEQEEKDRNDRSRYNGRLFMKWLQDVDDKWDKIKVSAGKEERVYCIYYNVTIL